MKAAKSESNWIYSDFKWVSEKKARLASKSRERLLRSLSGGVRYSFLQNKLHIGKLSPGCLICGRGYWSCMFINRLCTANCFYCPRDKRKEQPPSAEKIIFERPKDYVAYLEKFNFKGVGFSGGEGLLVFEKLLTYVNAIRDKFKNNIYIWIYTNGDLVNKDKLRELKKSGLDEIRFDISARGYSLDRVAEAVGIIKTVTVEIPCIPEDYEILKKCLIQMKKIGVSHLNIHQLYTTKYNYRNLIKRNYTFLRQELIPVLESEMSALKLVRDALNNRVNLPINYCSAAYKVRLQSKGRRHRFGPFVKDEFEDLTDSGYIRSIFIKGPTEKIKRIIKNFRINNHRDGYLSVKDNQILLSAKLLKYINLDDFDLNIEYFQARIGESINAREKGKEITLSSRKKIPIIKKPIFQWKGFSSAAKKIFQKLSAGNIRLENIPKCLFRNYNLNRKESIKGMRREIESLMTIEKLEHLEKGFPEIY